MLRNASERSGRKLIKIREEQAIIVVVHEFESWNINNNNHENFRSGTRDDDDGGAKVIFHVSERIQFMMCRNLFIMSCVSGH